MAAQRKNFSMDHPVVITLMIFAIIAFMYFAGEVLKPLALAILLSFALVPISRFLENRGLPRVPSVVLTVLMVLGGLGFVGYKVGQELNVLANELPKYEDNINRKISGMKPSQANTITNVTKFVGDVSKQIAPTQGKEIQEVRIVTDPDFAAQAEKTLGPYMEGLGTGFIILILLLYLMINRENMSDRLIRVFGRGKISLTTRTIEEVGHADQQVPRHVRGHEYAAGDGDRPRALGDRREVRHPLGLPGRRAPVHPLRRLGHGVRPAAAVLRSRASETWRQPLMILGVFMAVEFTANMLLEPVIYGKTTGVSALALLVSAMFWTWLWGGLGLLLSTPLTVCLAVLGKYVPSLGFFATFLREEVDLDPGVRFYQRLLAMDQDGATGGDRLDRSRSTRGPRSSTRS